MSKMLYEDFTKEVAGKIRAYLPVQFSDADVELKVVTKNNDQKLTGLTIKSVDSNISPTIYLEKFYEDYQSGEEMSRILEKIAETRVATEVGKHFETDFIMNFESCKDRIIPRLISLEMNQSLLETRPHKVIEDLAVTYHVVMNDLAGGMASAAVSNQMLASWGISVDELNNAAVNNLHSIMRSTVKTLSDVLAEMIGDKTILPDDCGMYVCSNIHNMFGASCLLDEAFMAHVVEVCGHDGQVTIIPSSVHEILVVNDLISNDALKNMICEVNETTVAVEDRLSNHPYIYSIKDGLKSV